MHQMLSMVRNYNSQEPGKTNANAEVTDASIRWNYNDQEPLETNTNEVHNDQHAT